MSEVPTVATRVDLDRTQHIESAVLAQLCAQSKLPEPRPLTPPIQAVPRESAARRVI